MKPIFFIVLAAGTSSRYGRNKLVELVDGKPMVARVVEAGLGSGLQDVVVVTGHEREVVLEALKSYKFEEVFNADYLSGMSTSVKAGVGSVKDRARAVVVCPGDMAFMDAAVVRAVVERYERSPSAIVVATYKGRNAHPILFDASLFADLLRISEGSRGMKEVVERHADRTAKVEVGTPKALLDIDYRTDWGRVRKELGSASQG